MFKGTAITTEGQLDEATEELESLFGSDRGTFEYDRAQELGEMIESYERTVFRLTDASIHALEVFHKENGNSIALENLVAMK